MTGIRYSTASTVPISQRCTNSQVGRVPKNSAREPAASRTLGLLRDPFRLAFGFLG